MNLASPVQTSFLNSISTYLFTEWLHLDAQESPQMQCSYLFTHSFIHPSKHTHLLYATIGQMMSWQLGTVLNKTDTTSLSELTT